MAKKTLTQAAYDVDNVQGLADQVKNQAALVKQTFDKTGSDAKTYNNNTLLVELQSETPNDSGAHAIGLNTANTVADNVADELDLIRQAGSGTIPPDDSITLAKQNSTVKTGLLADLDTINKSTFKDAINEVNGKVLYGNTVNGTDALAITTVNGDFTFAVGEVVKGIATNNNTTSMTVDVDSDGALPIKKLDGSSYVDVEEDDFEENKPFELIGQNDGVIGDFFLLAPKGSAKQWADTYTGANEFIKDANGNDLKVSVGRFVYTAPEDLILYSAEDNKIDAISLLHFNGTDTSTTITDDGFSELTWTANGNAQLDTAEQQFGTASLLLDGTGDWVDTPSDADLNLTTDDFIIDFWFKRASESILANNQWLCGQANASATDTTWSSSVAIQGTTAYLQAFLYSGTTAYQLVGTTVINDTDWHHVELSRNSGVLYLFLDGALEDSLAMAASVNNSTNKFSVGRLGEYATDYFDGWVDEFRYTVGQGGHTSAFTPLAVEYELYQKITAFPQAVSISEVTANYTGLLKWFRPTVSDNSVGHVSSKDTIS